MSGPCETLRRLDLWRKKSRAPVAFRVGKMSSLDLISDNACGAVIDV
jgi:hypothetical protein